MNDRDFKEKVLPVSNKILRFAIRLLNDEDEAKDVTQDIFLKLWQQKEKLNEVKNMEAFTMQMTRNRCIDKIRNKKMFRLVEKEQVNMPYKEADIDSHKKLELTESTRIIHLLINKLPRLQREVMHLRDIEQFDYKKIAEITEIEINAIRVNLSRARKKVREEFIKIHNNEKKRNKISGTKVL